MPDFASLESLADHFAKLSDAMDEQQEENLKRAAEMIRDEAKRVIGTYDYGWRELAPATIADRVRQGYAPDQPLLRSGAMRESIEYTIIEPGKEAEIGSNDPIAVFQELGTATIPPRSFLLAAALHELPRIQELAGQQAVKVFRA
jgi:hypothetical protein